MIWAPSSSVALLLVTARPGLEFQLCDFLVVGLGAGDLASVNPSAPLCHWWLSVHLAWQWWGNALPQASRAPGTTRAEHPRNPHHTQPGPCCAYYY